MNASISYSFNPQCVLFPSQIVEVIEVNEGVSSELCFHTFHGSYLTTDVFIRHALVVEVASFSFPEMVQISL